MQHGELGIVVKEIVETEDVKICSPTALVPNGTVEHEAAYIASKFE